MAEEKGLAAFRFAQVATEVRYPKAHRYWDDCGKVVSTLESRLPGLVCERLGPSGFEFAGSAALGITAATFYWDKTVITLTDPGAAAVSRHFSDNAAELWRLVALGLGIDRVGRVGHRLWHYMPFADIASAIEWLALQRVWSPVKGSGLENWGEPSTEATRLQFALEDRSVVLRIGSASMTAPAQKAQFGVFVDTDFFLTRESQPASQVDLGGFIKSNVRFLDQRIASLFQPK